MIHASEYPAMLYPSIMSTAQFNRRPAGPSSAWHGWARACALVRPTRRQHNKEIKGTDKKVAAHISFWYQFWLLLYHFFFSYFVCVHYSNLCSSMISTTTMNDAGVKISQLVPHLRVMARFKPFISNYANKNQLQRWQRKVRPILCCCCAFFFLLSSLFAVHAMTKTVDNIIIDHNV